MSIVHFKWFNYYCSLPLCKRTLESSGKASLTNERQERAEGRVVADVVHDVTWRRHHDVEHLVNDAVWRRAVEGNDLGTLDGYSLSTE